MVFEKFIWDMTYACPLRCAHCYSESGRRPAGNRDDDVMRIAEIIAEDRPKRVSLSGGEPLVVKNWAKAARRIHDAGAEVTLFTSGWTLEEADAERLATSVTSVCVSVDGGTEQTHDALRGRSGSFGRAMAALEKLDAFKRGRDGQCYKLGIDYTVVRSNLGEVERFVEDVTARFPGLDDVRFAMAMPSGLAAEEAFAAREILTDEQNRALCASGPALQKRSHGDARISIADVRGYRLHTEHCATPPSVGHIEPDGRMRAFPIYEAKVGSAFEQPLDEMWRRMLAWQKDPFVVEQLGSVETNEDWARAARALDRRFGSSADKGRIALRVQGPQSRSSDPAELGHV
ncbi:radical SAM protein [Polyangium sp. 6x1]|uniref:radical SAM protein n=1 Tax=Polyangium sp. 6x1 TaxID=3042689 RepID=UPI0024824C9E|nr:radical SAM protein [Polyangium sp. 6x1]MDI1450908.1 radical SAM protein [Polyangium sp. 6x1]